MNYSKFRTEGSRGIDDLCYVSELLGYRGSFPQLICNNGAAVSSLLNFLEDNPGCIEAMYDWMQDNYPDGPDQDDEGDNEAD